MSETVTLAALPRQRAGKGTARQTRRNLRIPAVIYGNKEKPVMISLDANEFNKLLHKPGFFTHLFTVTVDGASHRVIPRDVQLDPVSDFPIHVDFLRVAADARIHVQVPVAFTNQDTSPGLKRGGTLNVVLHRIDVVCSATAIPEHINIDVGPLDLGSSIHLKQITLPAGVVLHASADKEATVVTIATPSGVRSEAAEGATAEAGKA